MDLKSTKKSTRDKMKFSLKTREEKCLKEKHLDKYFTSKDNKCEEDFERDEINEVKGAWSRSAPAELFYQRDPKDYEVIIATKKLINLCEKFDYSLLQRSERIKSSKLNDEKSSTEDSCNNKINSSKVEKDSMIHRKSCHSSKYNFKNEINDSNASKKSCDRKRSKKNNSHNCSSAESEEIDSDDSDTSSSSDSDDNFFSGIEEMEKKRKHPNRLHEELWFNDPGEMNDGPSCRCSLKARRSGIRHGYYVGEKKLEKCEMWSNNSKRLHHYLIIVSPPTNFLVKTPTIITHDDHEYIFEGFSLFSHFPLEEVPTCQVIRFNIEYSVFVVKDEFPENFCVKELDIFYEYIFKEILELMDLNFRAMGDEDGCPRFHFMPRFVRKLPDNGKEILSMNEVLSYLLKNSIPLIKPEELSKIINYSERDWLNYTDHLKGMIVTYPGKKPRSIRVDQLDRDEIIKDGGGMKKYPVIVHFGIRPPQLSYAGNPLYQKTLREYVRFRHLLANMPKPSQEDKRQMQTKENRLKEMRLTSGMKREITIDLSSEGAYKTGIMCDVVQHALLIPVLVRHLRFHQSLENLEETISYKFKNKFLLQLALTHPSYRENFGTNPDHARNSLTNCGVRHPEYGDKKIQYMNTHKRGINTLVNIMSRFATKEESQSKITHNERLEFLGDAVVEFLATIHLFHLFPALEEGGLATYRAAVVQNQHLSVLAEKLDLSQYALHAHGSDLCHTYELRHAMANCFEALMGAIFIDSGINEADSVFSSTLFKEDSFLLNVWTNYKLHPLQEQEPEGDRKWVETYPVLQKLSKFEESIGIFFRHIRLLARAFTDKSVGFNYLTLGSNQRLEFLGDTVLQLIASEYLYKHFPEHHEGHLSLLRSSLVNNRTQAVVCDDLNMTQYAIFSKLKLELKTKDRADLLEAFLGALYIDKGLGHCIVFCNVCFFPRLQQFIINQEWNDPKSKLQQCCLTLRSTRGGEPDIPVYKVIEALGPTNTRIYTVAVYFKHKRLSKASGHSIQRAEMLAAEKALDNNQDLFPQLNYQKKVLEKNIKRYKVSKVKSKSNFERGHKVDRDSPRRYTKYDSRKFDDDISGRKYPRSQSSSRSNTSSKGIRSSPLERSVRSNASSKAIRSSPLTRNVRSNASSKTIRSSPLGRSVRSNASSKAIRSSPLGRSVRSNASSKAIKSSDSEINRSRNKYEREKRSFSSERRKNEGASKRFKISVLSNCSSGTYKRDSSSENYLKDSVEAGSKLSEWPYKSCDSKITKPEAYVEAGSKLSEWPYKSYDSKITKPEAYYKSSSSHSQNSYFNGHRNYDTSAQPSNSNKYNSLVSTKEPYNVTPLRPPHNYNRYPNLAPPHNPSSGPNIWTPPENAVHNNTDQTWAAEVTRFVSKLSLPKLERTYRK